MKRDQEIERRREQLEFFTVYENKIGNSFSGLSCICLGFDPLRPYMQKRHVFSISTLQGIFLSPHCIVLTSHLGISIFNF